MKTTLLVTTFNSLSQLIYTYLKDRGHLVDLVYINSTTRDDEIEEFEPDIILCPFLIHKVPESIYSKYPTFIFHPGVIADRGAYSLENVVYSGLREWGVVILRANDVWDGGEIFLEKKFQIKSEEVRDKSCRSKASIYRCEVKEAYFRGIDEFFENFKSSSFVPQVIEPLNTMPDVGIDWQEDTTLDIIKKINTFDSNPGILDEILGVKCHLFGAWEEERLGTDNAIEPKSILAKRDGAICLKTKDGAVWISHLKEPNHFKLPATYVLKERLKGVRENRLPLIFDKSYKTFYEISCDIKDEVAYLHFNFHNGAFRAEQCIRLKYAIEYLKDKAKVLVLMGGDDFFSNGINLNILEDSKKSGEDGWSTINAINDLVKSIIYAENLITVASLHKNAGAGGVFLATACDFVVAREDVVLNPHYQSLGLSGSEYHSYSLPKRVGEDMAKKLLNECLPISGKFAKEIGLVDEIFQIDSYQENLENFCQNLIKDEEWYSDFMWDKEDYLEENQNIIEQHKEQEIKIMYPEFWDEDSIFHKLRYEFVYKVCPIKTPERLKVNR